MALIDIKELHLHVNLAEISQDAKEILKTVHKIFNQMATKAQFEQAFNDLSAAMSQQAEALSNILADIAKLSGQIAGGGLSETEEDEVLASLQAKVAEAQAFATKLKEAADITPDDAPPADPNA